MTKDAAIAIWNDCYWKSRLLPGVAQIYCVGEIRTLYHTEEENDRIKAGALLRDLAEALNPQRGGNGGTP